MQENSLESKPWEPVPGEPTLWHDRFHKFMLLGPDRSIRGLYRQITGKTSAPPSSWSRMAKRWQWVDRANAWDSQNHAADLVDLEADRQIAREQRKQTIDSLFDLLRRIIQTAKADEKPSPSMAKEIVNTAKVVLDQSRAEHEPTQPGVVVNNTAQAGIYQADVDLNLAPEDVEALKEIWRSQTPTLRQS